MVDPIPPRLAGYGAYNLCFDNLLGRRQKATDLDFFKTIRQQLKLNNINLVRVICFRHSQKESLPAGRAIPLYVKSPSGIKVNEAFLRNLEDLVKSAQESNFWVQVSIFHYHAIATPDGTGDLKPELPELLPVVLEPNRKVGACQRLRTFFNPNPAKPEQLTRQKDLAGAIVDRLKGRPKVIYEIGNELRLDKGDCTKEDNFRLAEWMNIIKDKMVSIDPEARIGTSTGKHGEGAGENEEEIFRDSPKKLVPSYFDFHSQEWLDNEKTPRIMAAANRAKSYLGIATVPPLIINDDGVHDANSTAANVQKWSIAAFGQGLHYATKNTYPNGGKDEAGKILDFNGPVIRALNEAARTTPFPP
jgi:hypothetical protein